MQEITSIDNGNSDSQSSVGFFLAAILVIIGFICNSDFISIVAGTIISMMYIYLNTKLTPFIIVKGFILGMIIFWSIQFLIALNYCFKTGLWPELQFKILEQAIPMIVFIPIIFAVAKWFLTKTADK